MKDKKELFNDFVKEALHEVMLSERMYDRYPGFLSIVNDLIEEKELFIAYEPNLYVHLSGYEFLTVKGVDDCLKNYGILGCMSVKANMTEFKQSEGFLTAKKQRLNKISEDIEELKNKMNILSEEAKALTE